MHNHGWSIIGEVGIMTVIKEPDPLKAECIFGVQRLLPLLDAFSKEIDGVRTAQDIEHIHRMRVASRRLRAALPLFASCFPEKKYLQWMEEIRKVARALGEARDTDVQIAFLTKLIKKRQARMHEMTPGYISVNSFDRRCGDNPPLRIAEKTLKTPDCCGLIT